MGLGTEQNANPLSLGPKGYLFVYPFSLSCPSQSLERAEKVCQTLSTFSIPLWLLQQPTVIAESH